MSAVVEEAASASLLVFELGPGRPFAARVEQVAAVIAADLPRTAVPSAPPHIAGVVNHRGRALAVLALDLLLGEERVEVPARLVVVEACELTAAIPVTRVRGIVHTEGADLGAPTDDMPYATGVLDLREETLQVLDLAQVLSTARG